MVINNATKNCLCLIKNYNRVVAHDWLTYLVVAACDGIVFYDNIPKVLYRQHKNNSIGSNNTLYSKIVRIKLLFNGQFKKNIDQNLINISDINSEITIKNLHLIEEFQKMRSKNLIERIAVFKKIGLYRQTTFGTLSLMACPLKSDPP